MAPLPPAMSPHRINAAARSRRSRGVSAWRLVACLLAALGVLAIGLGSVSPGAHKHVHGDADHPEHACAITLAAVGFCDTAAPGPELAPDAQRPSLFLPAPESFVWTTPAYWLIPAHAPPARRA